MECHPLAYWNLSHCRHAVRVDKNFSINSNCAAGMLGSMEREMSGLMHDDVVDDVGKRALQAIKQEIHDLFDDEYFDKAFSQGVQSGLRGKGPVCKERD